MQFDKKKQLYSQIHNLIIHNVTYKISYIYMLLKILIKQYFDKNKGRFRIRRLK